MALQTLPGLKLNELRNNRLGALPKCFSGQWDSIFFCLASVTREFDCLKSPDNPVGFYFYTDPDSGVWLGTVYYLANTDTPATQLNLSERTGH